jgi:hypothetical protein
VRRSAEQRLDKEWTRPQWRAGGDSDETTTGEEADEVTGVDDPEEDIMMDAGGDAALVAGAEASWAIETLGWDRRL